MKQKLTPAQIAAIMEPHRPHGFVYFITDGEAIKIGFSVAVEIRLNDLQVSHAKKLTVIATIRGTRATERILHRKFAHLRIRGEWFRDDPELREFIAESKGPKERPIQRVRLARVLAEPTISGIVAARGVIVFAHMARASR